MKIGDPLLVLNVSWLRPKMGGICWGHIHVTSYILLESLLHADHFEPKGVWEFGIVGKIIKKM